MIRLSKNPAKAMEFTTFKKKENVTDDELLWAVLEFEKSLSKQKGIIFHCLVRNFKNEYANVLFADSVFSLKELETTLGHLPEVKNFFSLIEGKTVKIEYHDILKADFEIPNSFSCIEKGTFSLNNLDNSAQ